LRPGRFSEHHVAQGSPVVGVGDTVVTWLVVGIIDRPMRGDFTVTRWVGVYNGRIR